MLAGVAVALSAGSKFRRTGDRGGCSGRARRGLEIVALALVFHFQAWMLGWSHAWRDLLRVDILNVMGPSIATAAMLWRVGHTVAQRAAIFAVATTVVSSSRRWCACFPREPSRTCCRAISFQ